MPRNDHLHIVATSDNHYLQHLAVVFRSLLSHLPRRTKVDFYVVHDGLTSDNRSKLASSLSGALTKLHYIEADRSLFANVHTSRHLNELTYYKVAIPELLRSYGLEKVIYLDSDVVVNRDIRPLWHIDLKGRALGAIRDIGGDFRKWELDMPESGHYFNAGVLVFNLPKWNNEGLTRRVMDFVYRHPDKLLFHDQDALNAMLHDDWLELQPVWNVQSNMLIDKRSMARQDPCVIHYTGSSKPWHYDNDHPYKDKYYDYLALTAWESYRPERTMANTVKYYTRKILPRSAISLLSKVRK